MLMLPFSLPTTSSAFLCIPTLPSSCPITLPAFYCPLPSSLVSISSWCNDCLQPSAFCVYFCICIVCCLAAFSFAAAPITYSWRNMLVAGMACNIQAPNLTHSSFVLVSGHLHACMHACLPRMTCNLTAAYMPGTHGHCHGLAVPSSPLPFYPCLPVVGVVAG